ncbi:cytochrome P450 [Xylariaceae sp. FL0804]|nr:cytochrome P450 [Xylariaceae sp. FL0804]
MESNAPFLQYATGFVVTLLLVFISSRLFFSPLKSYPGPLLARLTNAYAGWHAVKGDIHIITYSNHLKYGPVVRQAPNRLVFNTFQALQDIYLNPRVAKAHVYTYTRFRSTPSVFTALDRDDHRRRRRVVGQAISERSMRDFEPVMLSQIDVFLVQILRTSQEQQQQKQQGDQQVVVEMTSRCKYLAMDVIGLLAFGCDWRTQSEERLRLLPRAFDALNGRVYLFMNWPRTHLVDPGVQWLVREKVERFRGILADMIAQRMALPRDARHDLYSLVASDDRVDRAQHEGIRKSEIWGEAGVFVNAGGTTTATAMSTIFYYLSRNPSAYARLASEVRTTFSAGAEIRQGPRLSSCRYLRAVIDESLRIAPPTPGVMWREQDPLGEDDNSTRPLVVDGHVIPPGTLVGVGLYSLMHNPAYFPEPFSFRPERWLPAGEQEQEEEQEQEARALMRRAFIPFILGDRACAGKAVAYLEMSLTVAKTMWYFDFEKAPGALGEVGSGRVGAAAGRDRPDEYQLYDSFMADHEGPNLIFRPREKYCAELPL